MSDYEDEKYIKQLEGLLDGFKEKTVVLVSQNLQLKSCLEIAEKALDKISSFNMVSEETFHNMDEQQMTSMYADSAKQMEILAQEALAKLKEQQK